MEVIHSILNNTTSLNVSARWNWASMEINDQHGTALDGHHFFGELTLVLE